MDVETKITQENVVTEVHAFSYPASAGIIYCG